MRASAANATGKIANGLSAFHQEQPETVAAEIAFHYELAGMEKKAIVYYEMAALPAEKIYANETRIKYYQKLRVLLLLWDAWHFSLLFRKLRRSAS
jgi:hypothetical protein